MPIRFEYAKNKVAYMYDSSEIDKKVSSSGGIVGPQGPAGPKGDTGIQGIQGAKGEQGIQGISGTNGYTPVKGVDYFDGAKGDKGDMGLQGIQGLTGLKGDTGSQGIQGLKGDKGDIGLQGLQGLQGIQGIKGDQGIQGVKGDTGAQGIAGTDANVTNANVISAIGYTPVSSADTRLTAATDIKQGIIEIATLAEVTTGTDTTRAVTAQGLKQETNKCAKLTKAVLPAASATYRGQFYLVQGATGVADKLYLCVKVVNDTYAWIDVMAFKFGY